MSDELIKTKEGSPFETEHAARIRKGILDNQGVKTEVVEVEGGFALKNLDPEKRPKRIPLGTRNVLRYPERPGYHRRVFNDVEDRILRAQQAGYEIVQQSDLPPGDPRRLGDASQMGKGVSKQVGLGVKGVLMEIPLEYYEADQKAKQDRVDRRFAAMKQENSGADGTYGKVDIGSAR